MTDDNEWDAAAYDRDAGFVSEYGEDVVDLLDPNPGERVLDLGCGTGHLTAEIAEAVGDEGLVLGIDNSAEMIGEARAEYPDVDFAVADGTEFDTDRAFDAVFSNAALHWMADQDAVAERVAAALQPGGRFVAEMGGHGNVETICEALSAAAADRGYDVAVPWHFPRLGAHASLLERHGFEVRFARLFDRPTEIEGDEGLRDWLSTFGDAMIGELSADERAAVVADVEDRLREELYDPEEEIWTAGYRRLRFVAVRE